MWISLQGKLNKQAVIDSKAIAVRFHNGQTQIKEDIKSKEVLYKYNMSTMIKEYKLL